MLLTYSSICCSPIVLYVAQTGKKAVKENKNFFQKGRVRERSRRVKMFALCCEGGKVKTNKRE